MGKKLDLSKMNKGKKTTVTKKNGKTVKKEEKKPLTKADKIKRGAFIGAGIVALIAILIMLFSGYADHVESGEIIKTTETKPVTMDGSTAIGQYSVKVYENIIIGKYPFVFENVSGNNANLQYSIMCEDQELFNTGTMAPGEAVSWDGANVEEQGRTYGCNIIVTASDPNSGELLNSMNIRQLIYIDNRLTRTTGASAYRYLATVDAYSKAEVKGGKTVIGYNIAVAANQLHPAEEGASLKLSVPGTVIIRGGGEELEATTNDLTYVKCTDQFLHMAGSAVVEGATGDNYKMTTEYYVNAYDQKPNAVFDFGNVQQNDSCE